nr:MAG TPA: Putative modification methylase [Caudoviricetes sp.]
MRANKESYLTLKLDVLELNEGQLNGVPKNPRFIKDKKFEDLKQSIRESPEFLRANTLKVYQLKNKNYIVIGGNMRLRACRELQMKEVPCYVFPQSTTLKKLREYAIKDNMAYGQIDWDAIANEWDEEELEDWAFDMPEDFKDEFSPLEDDEEQDKDSEQQKADETRPEVEELLNRATKGVASDILAQFDALSGFSFITPNTALFDFIRFAYYGKDYPRYNSLAFHPQQFKTVGDQFSTYEGLQRICKDEAKAERLRFVCADKFKALISGSLAFSGAKMPLDFPADLAKSLIDEFCPIGGRVLDACAGWGGRLVGFLASNAGEYNGTDASPYQIEGDKAIWSTFQGYTEHEKAVTLNCSPFEKQPLQERYFDFALTSPPYFDTEKYLGGEQSRESNENYKSWRDNFYRVLIQKVFDALKHDAYFCLQVGSQRYPLLEDGKKLATDIGFSVFEVRSADMKNNFNKTEEQDGEVIIILHKS